MALPPDFIPIREKIEVFREYLDLHDRVILSGKFGDGKSVFISELMEVCADDYLFIALYPVNYQVAENRDIMEYIKRDILIRLMVAEPDIIDREGVIPASFRFADPKEHSRKLRDEILGLLPQLNLPFVTIDLAQTFRSVARLSDKLGEIEPDAEMQIDELLAEIENTKGSIYEFNPLSQLITNMVRKIKEKGRKVVLIIEDLDRIDPSHIFRVLNVFSAHFDCPVIKYADCEVQSTNKFGIDKVVTVCDYDNIRNIYAHLYGPQTDFQGYIGKFSQSPPRRFSLRESYQEFIAENLPVEFRQCKSLSFFISVMISADLTKGMTKNDLSGNIRTLTHMLRRGYMIKEYKIVVTEGISIRSNNPMTRLMDLLKRFGIQLSQLADFIDSFRKDQKDPYYSLAQEAKNELYAVGGVAWLCVEKYMGPALVQKDIDRIIFAVAPGFPAPARIDGDFVEELDVRDLARNRYRNSAIRDMIGYFTRMSKEFEQYLI